MFFIKCILKPLSDATHGGAIGLCWADTESLDEARIAAEGMATDGGLRIESIEEASVATLEDFDGPGRDFYRRGQAQGVFMVIYTWPAGSSAVTEAGRVRHGSRRPRE